MSRMKLYAVRTALAVCVLSTCALADDATKATKVEKMMELANARQTVDQTVTQLRAMTRQQIAAMKLPSENQSVAAEIQDKVFALIAERMNWDRLKPEFVKLYSDTFTEEELDGMIAFYQSPAGKSMLAKTPQLMQKSMQLGMAQMQGSNVEIQRIVAEAMKKASPAAAPKPASLGMPVGGPSNATDKK